jgi:hypothetical protein
MCVQSVTECGKVFVISRRNECKVLCTVGKPSSQTCYKVKRFLIQITVMHSMGMLLCWCDTLEEALFVSLYLKNCSVDLLGWFLISYN